MARGAAPLVVLGCFGLACGSDPKSAGEPDSSTPKRTPEEVARAIGTADGSAASVDLVVIYERTLAETRFPTALAWNPAARDELWATLSAPDTQGQCTPTIGTGCTALEGRMAIIRRASTASPEAEVVDDGNSWHFLRRPMGLAFGPAERRQFLCTCGEARTANYTDEEIPFNGPVLWDADPAIFGAEPRPPTNSTHVDMLHETPYCMGVAHERGNAYWVFNGDVGAFDRYDFHEPHEPGADDHSDGEVWRYGTGELARVPGVPSHLAYDPERRIVFAADSGNGRVAALDATSGVEAGDIVTYDPIDVHVEMGGASVTTFAELEMPSGLALHEGVLFVTDHQTSRILALNPDDGSVINELQTDLPANSLAGIAIGPDDKAYITDILNGRVLRIEPVQ